MNLYACTLTFVGEAESADDFGEILMLALAGDEDARKVVGSTDTPHVVRLAHIREDDAE